VRNSSLPWFFLSLAVSGVFLTPRAQQRGAAEPAEKHAAAQEKPPLKPGEIELEKSRIYVRVGKLRLGHEHAVTGEIKSGKIDLSATKDVGEIEFDMASFTADSDEARKYVELKGSIAESTREKVTDTMRGADVLDVENFPTARFKIKSAVPHAERGGERSYDLDGEFTLHGKTRPLLLKRVKSERKEDNLLRLKCEFAILQSDFGITPYKAALGTVGVTDELKIWGDLWIAPPPATTK
jgi:polyisoprenoid-binding protein YceI